jgi:hypothetical protein
LLATINKEILIPSDIEETGTVYISWRGPSAVDEWKKYILYTTDM